MDIAPWPVVGRIMIDKRGEVLGWGGVVVGNTLVAFSRVTEEGRKYPLSILDMAQEMRGVLSSFNRDVIAVTAVNEKNPGAFMEYIGFIPQTTDDGDEYYRWCNG